jgi:hypothetical protein
MSRPADPADLEVHVRGVLLPPRLEVGEAFEAFAGLRELDYGVVVVQRVGAVAVARDEVGDRRFDRRSPGVILDRHQPIVTHDCQPWLGEDMKIRGVGRSREEVPRCDRLD